MDVLLTGALGRVGTAIADHSTGDHRFHLFDRLDHPDVDVVGDVADFDAFRGAAGDADAIVHLAGASRKESPWPDVLEGNVVGGYNCFEAARQAEVEKVVLASSNRVVGMYEQEHAPDVYDPDYDLVLDANTPVRPDSYYATSKVFDEALGRYYVENRAYPKRVYALRICSVRAPPYDHPFGDAEIGVERGELQRGSDEYHRVARRLQASWLSRRDAAALIDACLVDDSVEFDVFYGVSDNAGRWFDIEHAAETIGFRPSDSAEEWSSPPDGGRRSVEGELADIVDFDFE